MMNQQKPPPGYTGPQYGRILNRHKRGRPKYGALARIKRRAQRLIAPLIILGLAIAGFFVLKFLELI